MSEPFSGECEKCRDSRAEIVRLRAEFVCELLTALREVQKEGFYGRAAARLIKERDALQRRAILAAYREQA